MFLYSNIFKKKVLLSVSLSVSISEILSLYLLGIESIPKFQVLPTPFKHLREHALKCSNT